MRMDPRGFVVVGIVAAVIVSILLVPRLLPPSQFNEITNNPPESEIDYVQTTNQRLLTAESNPDAILDSINEVHFYTSGEDICLFGNFTSTGNGDSLIDFLILTDQGYFDYIDDGFVDSDSVFLRVNDTSGFYWERVLPHLHNGVSVTTWYVVYSAFRKPWWQPWAWFQRQYRDASAKTCQDYTPPNYRTNFPDEQATNKMILNIQVFDDRCSVSNVSVLINGTSVAYYTSTSEVIEKRLEWPYPELPPGNYSFVIMLYVEDAVGNHQTHYIDTLQITVENSETQIRDNLVIVSIVLFVLILIAVFTGASVTVIVILSIGSGIVGTGAFLLGGQLGLIGLIGCLVGFLYFGYRMKYPHNKGLF